MGRKVSGALAALSLVFCAALAHAQAPSWPSRPVKIIVPHSPGGVTDVVTRIVSQPLSEALGQPVIIENKPGASGLLGTDLAAKAPADGYTLLMFVDTNTIFPSTVKQLQHDPAASFVPITLIARGSHVIIAHPSLPANNLQELIAYARAQPNGLSFASPGSGSPQHLAAEILQTSTGMKLIHIPYKGGGQAIGNVLGGQVPIGLLGMAPALPHIKAGKLKAIAVTGKTRSAVLPETPTVAESGVPGFETIQWQGLVAPAGTPPEIIARVHAAMVKVMGMPAVTEKVGAIGMESVTSPAPQDFQRMIADELKRWPGVVKAAGVQQE